MNNHPRINFTIITPLVYVFYLLGSFNVFSSSWTSLGRTLAYTVNGITLAAFAVIFCFALLFSYVLRNPQQGRLVANPAVFTQHIKRSSFLVWMDVFFLFALHYSYERAHFNDFSTLILIKLSLSFAVRIIMRAVIKKVSQT